MPSTPPATPVIAETVDADLIETSGQVGQGRIERGELHRHRDRHLTLDQTGDVAQPVLDRPQLGEAALVEDGERVPLRAALEEVPVVLERDLRTLPHRISQHEEVRVEDEPEQKEDEEPGEDADAVIRAYREAGSVMGAGRLLTYTMTVTNRGPSDARQVVVADLLPPGVERQQIKWVALGLGIGLVLVAISRLSGVVVGSLPMVEALADAAFDLPIYQGALPFPRQGEWATPFRRFGQSLLYRWYHLRDEVLFVNQEIPRISGSIRRAFGDGSILNANAALGFFINDVGEDSLRSGPGQPDRVRVLREREREYNYEFGGDYELGLGGGRLKLIGLRRFEHSPFRQTLVQSFADGTPTEGLRFTQTADETETIARGEYRWRAGRADWQVSLEGALNRIVAYAAMGGMPISIDLAQAVLSNVLYNPKRRMATPERIAQVVADYYGVDLESLRGQKRDRAIVLPRQIAMYIMRAETDVSLLRIGQELGGRDHSTVLHACDKIDRETQQNEDLRRELAAVKEMIYAD